MIVPPQGAVGLSATQGCALVSNGGLSAGDWAGACLARIAQRDPDVGAWACLMPDIIREGAARIDSGAKSGVLAGLPVGIKDVIDVAGLPTGCNSPVEDGRIAARHAAAVERLVQAGALPLGKTTTTEYAFMAPAGTRNPHDPCRTPGGSSSGSAAAVADFHVPVALTTQTGGSTIRPAAYCGIVGYKPPFGQVPTDGLHLLAPSLDVIGLHARSVADIARVAAVMEGRALPIEIDTPLCFGLLSLTGATVSPPMRSALDVASEALRAAGARVLAIDVPAFDAELDEAHRVIMSVEVARSFSRLALNERALLSQSLSQFIARGERTTGAALADAQACVARAKARLSQYHGVILVGPSAEGEAPIGLASTGSSQLTRPWSLLLTGAVTLPCGFGPVGMPLGLQLIDPAPDGLGLLPAAAFAETALFPLSSQTRNAA